MRRRHLRALEGGRASTGSPEALSLDRDDPAFRRRAVEIANEVRPHLQRSFANVQAALDGVPVAFGVWQDPAGQNGVEIMIVKGMNVMRDIVAEGEARSVEWTAIPCTCAEQAMGLRTIMEETERVH